ncbi:MAG: maleylpyruvate isomerase family mycothiol-dependent enzyme [Ilumatobacteraceae bacterium]
MADSIPKDRTVAALEEVWTSVGALLRTLDDDEWRRPSPLPGWDVQDNVAHMIGTELLLRGESPPEVEVDRDANPHVRSDIAAFNEAWVISMRERSPVEMIARFDEVTAGRLEVLRAMSDEEWNVEGFTPAGKHAYGRFIQIRVFDCWFHEQDIRDAVGRPGHESGLAVDVTLDEMTTAMGFVVGKRAGVASGQSVTFAVTDGGAPVREIHVAVAERASVVDSLDGPATTTISLPVGVMTRLAGGRVALADVRDQIEVVGDGAVGDAVLANLNYTI